MLNKYGSETNIDYHTAKKNLGLWVRRNKNMRTPHEVSNALKFGYEMIWDAAYQHNIEPGFLNRYLLYGPETV